MRHHRHRRLAGLAALTAVLTIAPGIAQAANAPAPTPDHTLASDTRFFVPPPADGSLRQIAQVLRSGDRTDAALLAEMQATPQAVWLTGGTPVQVGLQVRRTAREARRQRAEPVFVLYDIPGRTGTPIETETLLRLAEHPRIVAVKDAKGDIGASSRVMAETDLVYYSGEDMLNLPWLSVGAVGFVSVHGHVVGDRLHEMIDAYVAGDVDTALAVHRELLPVYTGMTRMQGTISTKAALAMLGLPGGPVRPPLADATPAEAERLRTDLVAGGVKLR